MKKIELTQNKFALVDDEDFERLNKWKWAYNNGGYATGQVNGKSILMHRLILKVPREKLTDHINLNKLDNRKENLRLATYSQNALNKPKRQKASSIYKGVSWSKQMQKWICQIRIKRKLIFIGLFDNERHAAMAWDIHAKELLGEFKRLNFLV